MLRNYIACLCMVIVLPAAASNNSFTNGPVFKDYGENAVVEGGLASPESQKFKVLFDISDRNETDKPHIEFDGVARFINMHVRAGVLLENIDIAMVIHGGASTDIMTPKAFEKQFNKAQPSLALVKELQDAGVRIILCGQTAAHHGLSKQDLVEGVEISLSAMTADALLQQQGYTLNPF